MSRIRSLLAAYESQLSLTWERGLHGAERVWFAVYDQVDERKLRALIGEFELATIRSGHSWHLVDVSSGAFEDWLSASGEREEYFAEPDFLSPQYSTFAQQLTEALKLECRETDDLTVFAVVGVGSLFGTTSVGTVVNGLADSVPGRLLVFFPGSVDGSTYRLLDARDGWNYRAVAIAADR